MKYLPLIALILILSAGCKKNSCVQCSQQVAAKSQTTTVYTNYNVVYIELCGREADTAMAIDQNAYLPFAAEHNFVPYTCFYNQ